jgi:two-component system NtrC family response regulator
VQEVEKLFVEESLIRNNWNVSKAARDVSMQRSNFQALMRKYGIKKQLPPA